MVNLNEMHTDLTKAHELIKKYSDMSLGDFTDEEMGDEVIADLYNMNDYLSDAIDAVDELMGKM